MLSQNDVFPLNVDVSYMTSILRTRNIPNLPESKWKEILNEQDFDNYIFEIREEILSRVFDEINKSFLKNYSVKYVVECSYESWKKIICLNFFFHDPCNEFYRKTSSWTPDLEPEPCKPDSWSRGNVSMKKQELQIQKPEQIDTVLSDYQLIHIKDYPRENYYSSTKIESQVETLIPESWDEPEQVDTQYQYATTTPVSISEDMSEEIIVNQMLSEPDVIEEHTEELFYKRLKRKDVSLPSILSGLKISPPRKAMVYSVDDYPKKVNFPPLRLPVSSAVRNSVDADLHKNGKLSPSNKSVNSPEAANATSEPSRDETLSLSAHWSMVLNQSAAPK